MPRWSRLFYEDWKRGRRGVQALACVLARVDSQGGNPSLAAASRRTSTAEVSISPFQLSRWKLRVCSCVCLCAGDYMVCVSVCARVCVCVRLLKDLLFGAVNFNDVCQPQYVESPGCGRDWSFLSLLWVYLKEVLFFVFFFETTTAAYFWDKYALFIDRDEDSSRRVCVLMVSCRIMCFCRLPVQWAVNTSVIGWRFSSSIISTLFNNPLQVSSDSFSFKLHLKSKGEKTMLSM